MSTGEPLSVLAKQILQDGVIDEDEVARLRSRLYADSRIDREEADVLFELNDATSSKNNHPAWGKLFVETISDFVLKDEESPGVVSEQEAAYLISHIQGDGRVDANEIALLVKIISDAKSCPQSLHGFVLKQLQGAIIQDKKIDADEVAWISTVIYGSGGEDGAGVSRAEADFLFSLDQATLGANNHPSWQPLFVRAITSHLLEDPTSPGVVSEAEARWVIGWLDKGKMLSQASNALLANLKAQAKTISEPLKQRLA